MRIKYSGRTLKKFGKIILKKTETKVEEKNSQFKGERDTFFLFERGVNSRRALIKNLNFYYL